MTLTSDPLTLNRRGSTGPAEHLLRTCKAPQNMAAANFVVIWKTDVKWHADEYTYVKIKTGNRIPIRRPSVFLNLNLPPSMEGPLSVAIVATWDDTAWIGGTTSGIEYLYRSVGIARRFYIQFNTGSFSLCVGLIWTMLNNGSFIRAFTVQGPMVRNSLPDDLRA